MHQKNVNNLEEQIRLNLRAWTQNDLKIGFHLQVMRFSIEKEKEEKRLKLPIS